jgi:hypothetical protein
MKKLILIGTFLLVSSGAFAQSSQGQGGAQAGTNGNAATTPNSPPAATGSMQTNGSSGSTPYQPSTTGPSAQAPTPAK